MKRPERDVLIVKINEETNKLFPSHHSFAEMKKKDEEN
jgi:hypothetical protein